MVLSMVNTALLDNAQNSGDITEIIQATQLMNARSKDVVVLYESAMKEKIRTVTNLEEYSLKNWLQSDLEGKKNMLNSYVKELAPIYGVELIESIVFESYEQAGDGIGYAKSGFTKEKDRKGVIGINELMLTPDYNSEYMWERVFESIRHELRHIYQGFAVEHPDKYLVLEEDLERWKAEQGESYLSPYDYGYNIYREQMTEIDARQFAELD